MLALHMALSPQPLGVLTAVSVRPRSETMRCLKLAMLEMRLRDANMTCMQGRRMGKAHEQSKGLQRVGRACRPAQVDV